jgi:hypothetical protein
MPANVSFGTVIKKGAVTLGDVTAISLSGISRAEIDVTALTDAAKVYKMGTVDSGTIEVSFNYDDSLGGYVPVSSSNTSEDWSIVLPSGPNTATPPANTTQTLSFKAFQQGFSLDTGVDAAQTGTLTLRIDGVVTFGTPAVPS